MNKKIALSVEQMKHLQKLGLNINDASLYYHFFQDGDDSLYQLCVNEGNLKDKPNSERCLPAYTLQNLLDKLSIDKTIEYNGMITVPILKLESFETWVEISWITYTDGCELHSIYNETPSKLDAAYELLCWCIENKFIDM